MANKLTGSARACSSVHAWTLSQTSSSHSGLLWRILERCSLEGEAVQPSSVCSTRAVDFRQLRYLLQGIYILVLGSGLTPGCSQLDKAGFASCSLCCRVEEEVWSWLRIGPQLVTWKLGWAPRDYK